MKLVKKLFKRDNSYQTENYRTIRIRKDDYLTLKGLRKEHKKSMTEIVHIMIPTYLGVQYGLKLGDMEMIKLERAAMIEEVKKCRSELQQYKNRFGQLN